MKKIGNRRKGKGGKEGIEGDTGLIKRISIENKEEIEEKKKKRDDEDDDGGIKEMGEKNKEEKEG